MSKLKKALAKADESRGFDNQKVIRGGIKPAAPVSLKTDETEKQKSKLDIHYSKTTIALKVAHMFLFPDAVNASVPTVSL